MFGVQLYKNNARALLLRILSILNLNWLQHARCVRGVYELVLFVICISLASFNHEKLNRAKNICFIDWCEKNLLKIYCDTIYCDKNLLKINIIIGVMKSTE